MKIAVRESREVKTEQFYMPAKFVPPIRTGDRYCFPDGRIWWISGVDVALMGTHREEVKITIYWARPLEPIGDGYDEWYGKYKVGDTNWIGDARAVEIWGSDSLQG